MKKDGEALIQRLQDMRQITGEKLEGYFTRFNYEMIYCKKVIDRETLFALRNKGRSSRPRNRPDVEVWPYCTYHQFYGHDTGDCRDAHLRRGAIVKILGEKITRSRNTHPSRQNPFPRQGDLLGNVHLAIEEMRIERPKCGQRQRKDPPIEVNNASIQETDTIIRVHI